MKIIIIDNDENWVKRISSNINKVLISENMDEKILCFNKYTKELRDIIYDESRKLYIIDIGLEDISGFDIAREIRDCANDWNSIIIISSIYNERENIISERLSVLTYISKLMNFDKNMRESIKLAIKILTKNNTLEFKESGIKNRIIIDNIIYIQKEKYSKYCTIKTTNGNFRVRDTITNLKNKTKLTQLKKDLLVNTRYIKDINDFENKK